MFRKKSLSDELFLHFFCKGSESGRFFIYLHDSNCFFLSPENKFRNIFGRHGTHWRSGCPYMCSSLPQLRPAVRFTYKTRDVSSLENIRDTPATENVSAALFATGGSKSSSSSTSTIPRNIASNRSTSRSTARILHRFIGFNGICRCGARDRRGRRRRQPRYPSTGGRCRRLGRNFALWEVAAWYWWVSYRGCLRFLSTGYDQDKWFYGSLPVCRDFAWITYSFLGGLCTHLDTLSFHSVFRNF